MFRVLYGRPVEVPANVDLARVPPRPVDLRQPGFESDFDFKTVFFDVFETDQGVRFSGPPLLNLKDFFASATWKLDGIDVSQSVSLEDRGHAQESSIRGHVGKRLSILSEDFDLEVEVAPDYSSIFDGRRVIYTKSKNNDLVWIRDWLTFYVRNHSVDAVLIYDNGSQAYLPEDLLSVLQEVDGVDVGLVISWPFKFGPQAGPSGRFDSDFFEYVVSSNAQQRFLNSAAGVIHADIDELVMTDDGRSVFEHARLSKTGYIRYMGRVIEGVPLNAETDGVLSFADFGYFDPNKPLSTPKWCCIPELLPDNVQWRTHAIHGMTTAIYDRVVHRHFFAVSTGWKFSRGVTQLKPEHTLDVELRGALGAAL